MTSHLGMMIVFAVCLASVFATLVRDEPGAEWRVGARLFAALVAGAILLGWVLRGLFG